MTTTLLPSKTALSEAEDYRNTASQKVFEALQQVGQSSELRQNMVELCQQIEEKLQKTNGIQIREEITGPIINALYANIDTVTVDLKNGLTFELPYRSKIARDLVLSGMKNLEHIFEPQTSKLIEYISNNAKNVLIGGAYAGDHALISAFAMKKNNGICHAFEPNTTQFNQLKKNAEANKLDNINAQCVGLWEDESTQLRLIGEQDAFAYAEVVQNSEQSEDTFPTTTIDAFGKRHQIDAIDLIMLDIEGSELPVLKGAQNYLAQPADKAPVVIFEVHRHYVDWDNGLENTEIVELLAKHGYTAYGIRDFQSNVAMENCKVELVPLDGIYLEGPPHGFNMLAFKNPAFIDTDLFKVVPNVSPKLLKHRDPAIHAPSEWQ